jgi:alpha-beta hydrolase superfamily lysophospholipase
MVRRAEFLRRAGYSTLLIDFQATGESAGEAITFGWRERFDVIAAVQYLKTRIPGQPVAVIAISLGGAATLLARPSLGLHGVVLEAVYPSIDRAVVNRLRMRIGPFGPVVAPLLLVQLRSRLGIAAIDLKPVEHIGGIGCPLLLIGGTLDRHTTVADTEILFEAARQPKELWLIPNAAHIDFLEFAGDAYRRRILSFLATAFGQPTG